MDKFGILSLRIVTGRTVPRISPENIKELHVASLGDWYYMKERIVIIRYNFYDAPFLLPKFLTP